MGGLSFSLFLHEINDRGNKAISFLERERERGGERERERERERLLVMDAIIKARNFSDND